MKKDGFLSKLKATNEPDETNLKSAYNFKSELQK